MARTARHLEVRMVRALAGARALGDRALEVQVLAAPDQEATGSIATGFFRSHRHSEEVPTAAWVGDPVHSGRIPTRSQLPGRKEHPGRRLERTRVPKLRRPTPRTQTPPPVVSKWSQVAQLWVSPASARRPRFANSTRRKNTTSGNSSTIQWPIVAA